MKKNYLIMLLVAIMPLTLTSCDPDDWYQYDYYDYYGEWYDGYDWYDDAFNYGTSDLNLMAQTLRGKWEGRLRADYINEYGQNVVIDYDTYMEFDQYNANSLNGRGIEEDYQNGILDAQETFSWYIDPRTRDIRIRFDGGREMRIRYRDMSLDSDYFSGTITGMNVDEYDDFSFRRTTFRSRSVTPDTRSGIGTDSVKVSTTSAKRLLKTMPTK